MFGKHGCTEQLALLVAKKQTESKTLITEQDSAPNFIQLFIIIIVLSEPRIVRMHFFSVYTGTLATFPGDLESLSIGLAATMRPANGQTFLRTDTAFPDGGNRTE